MLVQIGLSQSLVRERESHQPERGFPGGSDSEESTCNAGDPGLILGQEDLLEEEMATHSSILAWKIHG